jgi:hypothetical protein
VKAARDRGYKAVVVDCVHDAMKHVWTNTLKATLFHEVNILTYKPSSHLGVSAAAAAPVATSTTISKDDTKATPHADRPVFYQADPNATVTFVLLLLGATPLPARMATSTATSSLTPPPPPTETK